MKINDIHRDLSIASNSTESLHNRKIGGPPQQEEVAPLEGQAKSEEVSISPASIEISKIAEMLERESPERAEKIQALQKAVQEGTYEVDPARVAEKMILGILSE
jgi:flagellar biosynthesis anti-sigma factor FlgM